MLTALPLFGIWYLVPLSVCAYNDVQRGGSPGDGGQVHIRVRRTPRGNVADVRRSRSQQSSVGDAAAIVPSRLQSAQILHSETLPISVPVRPPTPPPPPPEPVLLPEPGPQPYPLVEATPPAAVKQRAVRQVVNVDAGLAGAPTLPVIVPPSFIRGPLDRREHPVSQELIAVGGIDLENLSGDMPGRLQCGYDSANNTWRTLTAQMPEFLHHHGLIALEGRLFLIG